MDSSSQKKMQMATGFIPVNLIVVLKRIRCACV